MRCQWHLFIKLVPLRFRNAVDKIGKEHLTELRMRIGQPVELVMLHGSQWLDGTVSREDIRFCVNAATQYSPWASASVAQGYIAAQGGHRVGICGSAVIHGDRCTAMDSVTSLCIRVARDVAGISPLPKQLNGSVLLIGPPGSGKTTLLRDMIRTCSNAAGGCIAVVDERGELFPGSQAEICFDTGRRTDVLHGCSKKNGITMLLRSMGPSIIAVDEITAEEDCQAILLAGWCGVKIFATAHAENVSDLRKRKVYKPLLDSGLFESLIVLQRDKSWVLERMPV